MKHNSRQEVYNLLSKHFIPEEEFIRLKVDSEFVSYTSVMGSVGCDVAKAPNG